MSENQDDIHPNSLINFPWLNTCTMEYLLQSKCYQFSSGISKTLLQRPPPQPLNQNTVRQVHQMKLSKCEACEK